MPHQPITFDLEEPLEAHGETITSVTLKPPLGKEILAAGFPFSRERNARAGTETMIVEMPAARLLISSMASIPASAVDQFSASDIAQALDVMRLFFFYRVTGKAPTAVPSA